MRPFALLSATLGGLSLLMAGLARGVAVDSVAFVLFLTIAAGTEAGCAIFAYLDTKSRARDEI